MLFENKVLDNVTREIKSNTFDEFLKAQGYFHYKDRALQIEMLRIISRGELSVKLMDNEETYEIDKFMRLLGIDHYAKKEALEIDKELKNFLLPYLEGINTAMKEGYPIELKLVGYKPQPYEVHDIIATIKIMSYMGLAQGQQDLEKHIIELIKGECSTEKIKSYFNIKDEITSEIIEKVKGAKVYFKNFDKASKFIKALPKISASNNWISNIDGIVRMACDPHLEINRIPSVWYEVKGQIKETNQNYIGITMPGVPGFIMGSNNDVCFSFTYGFMDQVDYFIEEVRDGKLRTESSYEVMRGRKEVIDRKSHLKETLTIYETKHGPIETNLQDEILDDGFYLSLSWSNYLSGGLPTLKALKDLFKCQNGKDLCNVIKEVTISCNWLIGDKEGDIYYQQSGKLPNRKGQGLIPLPAFKKENKWKGFVDSKELVHLKNPDSKILVTANNLITYNGHEKHNAINAPMGDYRKDTIVKCLENTEHSCENFKTLQQSLYSSQARIYCVTYKELQAELSEWNYEYDVQSTQATMFEIFYKELFVNFYKDHFVDKSSSSRLFSDSAFVADFYDFFDQCFLNVEDHSKDIFFKEKSREEYIRESIQILKTRSTEETKRWGEVNQIDMNNIFFDGKLPKFLGLDLKNVEIPGNRATVSQGSVMKAHGRHTSFCPSWRFIIDFKDYSYHSLIPGGLSDRRFPKDKYLGDIENYFTFNYRSGQI